MKRKTKLVIVSIFMIMGTITSTFAVDCSDYQEVCLDNAEAAAGGNEELEEAIADSCWENFKKDCM